MEDSRKSIDRGRSSTAHCKSRIAIAYCSLDTPFVLRMIIGSPVAQLPLALALYEEQLQAGGRLFISVLYLSGSYFAL